MFKQRSGVVFCLTVLLLVGALPSGGRADFELWGDEQLTVDATHSVGNLHERSRVSIVSGGWINNLSLRDDSAADMSGGRVNYLRAYDANDVAISGGYVGEYLDVYGASTVEISPSMPGIV